jgi:hypothetical protein
MIKWLLHGLSENGKGKPMADPNLSTSGSSLNPLKRSGPISSGALNLTLGSGVVAAVVAFADVFKPDFIKKILGDNPASGSRAAVFIAVVGAWALIAVADILARSRVHSSQGRVLPVPHGLKVTRPQLQAQEESGWIVVALRVEDDSLSYLVTKPHTTATWVKNEEVTFA